MRQADAMVLRACLLGQRGNARAGRARVRSCARSPYLTSYPSGCRFSPGCLSARWQPASWRRVRRPLDRSKRDADPCHHRPYRDRFRSLLLFEHVHDDGEGRRHHHRSAHAHNCPGPDQLRGRPSSSRAFMRSAGTPSWTDLKSSQVTNEVIASGSAGPRYAAASLPINAYGPPSRRIWSAIPSSACTSTRSPG